MEREYKAGYIWRQDMIFNANIDSIRNVMNAKTKHKTLMEWRVNEMYERLKEVDANGVSVIILRSIAYRYERISNKEEIKVV